MMNTRAKPCLTALAIWCSLTTLGDAAEVHGAVFRDQNADGKRDRGELGIPGALVTDGRTVVVSDREGAYTLHDVDPASLIWVTTPRDHRPVGAFFRSASERGVADFPLAKSTQSDRFFFIQVTDTHVGRGDLVRQFCELVNRFPESPAFVINTGDLGAGLDTALPGQAQFGAYLASTALLRGPQFHVPGNHDHTGINNPHADRNHVDFGKGLYRRTFGPTYYSWDWGQIHFVALDGTRIPYREALGDEQRAWLVQDLNRQPESKPIVLFCHQSLPNLSDQQDLIALLAKRHVLAAFCGHLHRNEIHQMGGFTVYHTGALSGSWWSGQNVDGSPQGFRVVSVVGASLSTMYFGREGPWPIGISRPILPEPQRGVISAEASVLDFGRAVKLSGTFGGHPFQLKRRSRGRWWSEWSGHLDTAAVPDGRAELLVTTLGQGPQAVVPAHFIAINGKTVPTTVQTAGLLKMQVSGVEVPHDVEFNGVRVGRLPPGLPDRSWVEFSVDAPLLLRLNTLIVRARDQRPGLRDQFNVGVISLEAGGAIYRDGCRFSDAWRYDLGPGKETVTIYFCLP